MYEQIESVDEAFEKVKRVLDIKHEELRERDNVAIYVMILSIDKDEDTIHVSDLLAGSNFPEVVFVEHITSAIMRLTRDGVLNPEVAVIGILKAIMREGQNE